MVRRWISCLVDSLVSDMTKYRIVERNKDRWGDWSDVPWYFLQVKIFDLFWIDYYRHLFSSYDRFHSYDTELEMVERCYDDIMKQKEPYKQKVVKTFYDEDT